MANNERVKTFMTSMTMDQASCEAVDSNINEWLKKAAPESNPGIIVKQITTAISGTQLITQILYEMRL